MAEQKNTDIKSQVGSKSMSNVSSQLSRMEPKIENIDDMGYENKIILIRLIRNHLKSSAYQKELGNETKETLDKLTDVFGIRELSDVCDRISYKTSAYEGIAILMGT